MLKNKLSELRIRYDVNNNEEKKCIDSYYESLRILSDFSLECIMAGILHTEFPDIKPASDSIMTLNRLAEKKKMPLIYEGIVMTNPIDIVKAAHETYNALN